MDQSTVLISEKGHRYRLHWSPAHLLHQGKYSTVILAEENDGSRYAAKIIRENTSVAEISLPVSHPVLLPPVDYCAFENGVVFFIPYFKGQPLTTFLNEAAVTGRTEHIIAVLQQLTAGFTALHEAGWYHGDVKPENILAGYTEAGSPEVRIVDFGKASPIGHMPAASTGFNLQYAAPEVILSARNITDQRADIYSLALLLYEWMEGRHPFVHSNPEMMMHLMMAAPLPVPREIGEGVKDVLLKAMQKPVFRRPPAMLSSAEAGEKLQQAMNLRWNSMSDFIEALLAFPDLLKPPAVRTKRSWWKW